MLVDRRSEASVTNFTGQLLNLRKLPDVTPDLKRFPDFDGTLRRETELFFESIQREDRSVLELLTAEHHRAPAGAGSSGPLRRRKLFGLAKPPACSSAAC